MLGLMSLLAEHYRFTADKFVRMADEGFFAASQRLELLDGRILIMHPVDYRHAHAVTALNTGFAELAHHRYSTSPQNPVELEKYSAPQPDICLVSRACRKSKRHPLPDQVYLMVEVSDSSLEYDRGPKMSAYALCGIREFWILNLQDNVLEIYRNPEGGTYREQVIVEADGQAAPQAFPDVIISLSEIIPER
jgi:Uma2 family endonuclease